MAAYDYFGKQNKNKLIHAEKYRKKFNIFNTMTMLLQNNATMQRFISLFHLSLAQLKITQEPTYKECTNIPERRDLCTYHLRNQ